MFHSHSYFYYITIGLDVICILHSIRNGTQNKWMLLIVFAPVIGALVYLFAEVFTRRNRAGLQDGISGILTTSNGRIRKLENNLKFTDTFTNRILLADAYLAGGHTDNADVNAARNILQARTLAVEPPKRTLRRVGKRKHREEAAYA